MFCPKCGAVLREGFNFCWNCGARVHSDSKEDLEQSGLNSTRLSRFGSIAWHTLLIFVLIVILMIPAILGGQLVSLLYLGICAIFLMVYCVRHGLKCQRERENKTLASEDVQSMTGLEYEHWCAKRMAGSGKYRKVTVTPPTGDFGADIVAVDAAKRTWVIQCKHYHSKLGNSPIQEVVSAKAHYGAECAAVVTNSTFTEKARQLAKENKVKLYEHVDGNTLHKKKWRNYSAEEMMFYDDIFN